MTAALARMIRAATVSAGAEKPQVLESELLEVLLLPGNLTDAIAGSVRPLQSPEQECCLLWRGLQLEVDRQLHTGSLAHRGQSIKHGRRSRLRAGGAEAAG